MPADSTSQTALVIIAIAVSLQTVMLIAGVIVATLAWKRTQAAFESRLVDMSVKLDQIAGQTRRAMDSMEHLSGKATDVFHDAGSVVRSFASAVTAPRAFLMAGAASAVSRVLSRWRGKRRTPAPEPATRLRSIH
jgi:hypothetical protein